MHLYFYGPPSAGRELHDAYGRIKGILDQTQLYVSTNLRAHDVQVSPDVLAETQATDSPLLEHMDAFIVEGTKSDPEIGFLLAHAMALKKPVLYLYQRGTVPQIFQHLTQRELPGHVKVAAYTPTNLETYVAEFLRSLAGVKVRPAPRIKFTLRITEAIESYLHFKTHNTTVSKADFVREEIERLMDADRDWQEHERRRRGMA